MSCIQLFLDIASRVASAFSGGSKPARSTLLVAAVVAAITPAAFASEYPERAVELIVPFNPGGGTDAVARAFADTASRYFSKPIVVVNRPGAAGAIGHYEGANARPDGYRVTMVTPEISLAYLQGIGKARYDDFVYIARINSDPIALVVKADAPWNTLEEFLMHAKSRPGEVTVGNAGLGATYHLAAIGLESKTGYRFNNIPYNGAGPEVNGLASGQVSAAFLTTGEIGTWVKAGKMRILAVMADRRLPAFDQVPTFKEKGIDIKLGTWRALAVPKATPPDVVVALRGLVNQVYQDKNYRDIFSRQFLGLVNDDGERFKAELEQEFKFYSETVEKLQLKK